ncbi:hydantoinase/oxoprolinase family protein [Paeniglutamicibacter sp. NPDC091659]|uniref:hydantoinase/oxoprolinase family protein n=1 Tax=Paeniglutamicibacter sp. NPDC091659 TaxID=3364389 RepID=UPI00382553F6
MKKNLRVGVDIGGTFTDIVVQDRRDGTTLLHKVLSTPANPSLGMLKGLDELGITADIKFLVHGTTAGLNALLSRTGERVALITTVGFQDIPILGRGGNKDIWNLNPERTKPLVNVQDIVTVDERTRYDGSVERTLQEDDIQRVARWLLDERITSVAVSFLHAHRNPANEIRLRERLAELVPEASIVLSHEVAPEQGEFERTSTTLATAYVARTVDRYLSTLSVELDERKCTAPLQVMRSSGGICSAKLVARQPIQTILSGPAGGVVAAETIARSLDRPNLIAIDMGGTSSDVSLVVDGRMTLATEGEIADQIMRMPVVELHTIGAGGGSIARAEAGGLRVGPKSAGSDPGPACYGQGGMEPTVTDAQVALGRIDPGGFLGGRMQLSRDAAEMALARLGKSLEIDMETTAGGIIAVANGMMANAIRTLTMRRGIDARDFSLVAFGGAGPLHGAALADELGIREVIVPFATGVLSAWGMLHADIRHDVSAPLAGLANHPETLQTFHETSQKLRAQGSALLDAERVPAADQSFELAADMRYVGQEHAISVGIKEHEDFVALFHDAYRRRYGHSMPQSQVEFVNLRIAAVGRVSSAPAESSVSGSILPEESVRKVRFDGVDHEARVVQRNDLGTTAVTGPAVIQEDGSTTLVPPSWQAVRGTFGTMILRKVGQ